MAIAASPTARVAIVSALRAFRQATLSSKGRLSMLKNVREAFEKDHAAFRGWRGRFVFCCRFVGEGPIISL